MRKNDNSRIEQLKIQIKELEKKADKINDAVSDVEHRWNLLLMKYGKTIRDTIERMANEIIDERMEQEEKRIKEAIIEQLCIDGLIKINKDEK